MPLLYEACHSVHRVIVRVFLKDQTDALLPDQIFFITMWTHAPSGRGMNRAHQFFYRYAAVLFYRNGERKLPFSTFFS